MITDDFPELEVLKSNFQGKGIPHTDNAISSLLGGILGHYGHKGEDEGKLLRRN